jgi:hypothetical protein
MPTRLETRLSALEARSGLSGALLIAGPMTEHEDPAPHFVAAQAEWERNHKRPSLADGRCMSIVLVGAKPIADSVGGRQ